MLKECRSNLTLGSLKPKSPDNGGMSHQIFILYIVSVSHLKNVSAINTMIMTLIDFA